MGVFKKIAEIFDRYSFTVPTPIKWGLRGIITVVVLLALFNTFILGNKPTDNTDEVSHNDKNVYLYEEITYADEIFIKCTGINVIEDENNDYTMNLILQVEQHNTDNNINQQIISPSMFSIKMADINAKSPMSVFVDSLAKATASVIIAGAIGEVNVIEQTLNFAGDYASSSIENSASTDDIKLAARDDSFEDFYPYTNDGEAQYVTVSFPLNEEVLNSRKSMVLSIDTFFTIEKNIFLVLRPNTSSYTLRYDLNEGNSDEDLIDLNIEPGVIAPLTNLVPDKDGYQFLYWTEEKDEPSTKVRDVYYPTYENSETYTLFAYYQLTILYDEYVNIGESIQFKDGIYDITVSNFEYFDEISVLSEDLELIELTVQEGNKYLAINIDINKLALGAEHELDNDNDFYLENEYVGKNVSDYYGYISKFEELKPVDDYTWIGLEINEIKVYNITLYFEIPEEYFAEEDLLFLEIDFFKTNYAKSILLQFDD